MDDLDKFFASLETGIIENESLDDKILKDFHGNVPIFNNEVSGKLPIITSKANIYISDMGYAEKFKDISHTGSVVDNCLIAIAT